MLTPASDGRRGGVGKGSHPFTRRASPSRSRILEGGRQGEAARELMSDRKTPSGR